jgi:hypothetical protein
MLAEREFSTVVPNGVTPVGASLLAAASEEAGAADPTGAPVVRHRQSQRQLANMAAAAKVLAGVENADADFQAAMASAGLLDGYLADCHAKYAAAQQAIEARHEAATEALAATEGFEMANFQAQAAYSAFRQVARTVVLSASGRAALKLDEATPTSRVTFLQTAQMALAAAQGEPHVTQLSGASFGVERMAATVATLEALATAITAQERAQHAARQATDARDAAMRELGAAVRQIKVDVKMLLRCNPQLRTPVGF